MDDKSRNALKQGNQRKAKKIKGKSRINIISNIK